MKSFKYAFLIALSAAFVFTSCGKDKENPTIVVNSPAEHTEYHAGDEVHINATVTDDKELASYAMEIGDADGEHIHDFHFDETANLSGKEAVLATHFTVPDSLSITMFFLHLTVTDAEGKTGAASHMMHIHQ